MRAAAQSSATLSFSSFANTSCRRYDQSQAKAPWVSKRADKSVQDRSSTHSQQSRVLFAYCFPCSWTGGHLSTMR